MVTSASGGSGRPAAATRRGATMRGFPMKTLACGELMPGCDRTFRAETEDELLAQAGLHAAKDHGLDVTPDLVDQVRAHIREEPAGVHPPV